MEAVDGAQDWFRPIEPSEIAAESGPNRDDVPSSATEPSDTDSTQGEVAVQPSPPAVTGEVSDVANPPPRQGEQSGHTARAKLAEHQALQAKSQAELEAIEVQLQTASIADAMSLTKRKRELTDAIEHVDRLLPRLQMHADQEHKDEVTREANALWAPLATKRKNLLAEVAIAADNLLDALAALDTISAEQAAVLDKARVADPSAQGLQSDLNGSRKHLAAWLARSLGIVAYFPAISSQVPSVHTIEASQEKFINSRIL